METALFSPASLFGNADSDEDTNCCSLSGSELQKEEQPFVERTHAFPNLQWKIRELSFHELNANLLWPGTFAFAEWLAHHQSFLHDRRILELGSGTGALATFLKISFQVDITTSDYDDQQIEDNIAYNCTSKSNGLHPLPHIRHTWGDPFPISNPYWDLIIASDILLYVKQYPNLIKTLCFLLKAYQPQDRKASITISGEEIELELPVFIMSWRRRRGKEDEQLFFGGCEKAGLTVRHVGSRVYCITVSCQSSD